MLEFFRGSLLVISINGTAPTTGGDHRISALFGSPGTSFDGSEVKQGDLVFIEVGNELAEYSVLFIHSSAGGLYDIEILDTNAAGTPTGLEAFVSSITPEHSINYLPVEGNAPAGNDATLINKIQAWQMLEKVDKILGTNIIENSYPGHGFDLTVAPYNTYGFIPVALTNGGIVAANTTSENLMPIGYVTAINGDVLTIQTTGELRTTHSLTVNETYFLQDDGSLATTPDSDGDVTDFNVLICDVIAADRIILRDLRPISNEAATTPTGLTEYIQEFIAASGNNVQVTANGGVFPTNQNLVKVYRNGSRLTLGQDFLISTDNIVFVDAGLPGGGFALAGENIIVEFQA